MSYDTTTRVNVVWTFFLFQLDKRIKKRKRELVRFYYQLVLSLST